MDLLLHFLGISIYVFICCCDVERNHEEMIEFQDREIKKLEIEALSEAFRGLQIK